MKFDSLGLSAPILKAVIEEGYETPSPIQAKAIPAVLKGGDVMAAAQTGTGKTAGFTLPLLERLSKGERPKSKEIRALVLTPTRELAAQVNESVTTYGRHLKLKSTVVFGGVGIHPQMARLRGGIDILIATPGRLLDLHSQKAINFSKLEVLILDEADRMLDMGFIHSIKKIIAVLPKKRQNLMFSATFSDDIRTLAKGLVNNPVEISVSPRNEASKTVEQWVCPVDKNKKTVALTKMIRDNKWTQVLVFTRTKHGANRLMKSLDSKGIPAAAIHGNKSQNARTRALADFKNNKIKILVATDIAARGIDIDQLPQVINFDLPNVPEDYVHRIGRTGRAGSTGKAYSLVSAEEFPLLVDIERLINRVLNRKEIEGFEPEEKLPESKLGQRVPKAKKKISNNNRSRPPLRNRPSSKSRSEGNGEETKSNAPNNRARKSAPSRNRNRSRRRPSSGGNPNGR